MIVLLDNGQDLEQCASELGCAVGQLLTPLTRYLLRDPSGPFLRARESPAGSAWPAS